MMRIISIVQKKNRALSEEAILEVKQSKPSE